MALSLGALALFMAAAEPAGAAVGELTFQGCIGKAPAAADCDEAAGGALDAPMPIAISPDATSLYLATEQSSNMTHLTRAEDGTIGFGSCLSGDPELGCTTVPGLPIADTRSIAVSPDNGAVYATSPDLFAASRFLRDPLSGQLVFSDCIASKPPQPACSLLESGAEGESLVEALGIAVSPDGSLYVAGAQWNALSELTPTGPAGELLFTGCIGEAFDGCREPADGPFGVSDVAIGPDGNTLYLGDFFGGAIAAFGRGNPIGDSPFHSCFGEAGTAAVCQPVPKGSLKGLFDVAVSPDGASVYTVAGHGNALAHFSSTPENGLAFEECFTADPQEGCTTLPGAPLRGPISLAVAPDGASVYVVAETSHTVSTFDRATDGSLDFAACVTGDPAVGCEDLPPGVMERPWGIAASLRGNSVYVTGRESHTVVGFERVPAILPEPGPEEPSPEEPGPEEPGPEEPGPDAPGPEQPEGPRPDGPRPPDPPRRPDVPTEPARVLCAGKPATIVGTPRADTLRGTPRRDVIAALGGADEIRGRGGNDLICGGKGKDTILGGGGKDRCLGGPGRNDVGCERGRTR